MISEDLSFGHCIYPNKMNYFGNLNFSQPLLLFLRIKVNFYQLRKIKILIEHEILSKKNDNFGKKIFLS